jgi:hypothetical protein
MMTVWDGASHRLGERHSPITRSLYMSRRHPLSRLALAAILILSVAGTACNEQPNDPIISTAPPRGREPLIDDPRIGDGLPAEVRFAGIEHNRLTVAMLRQSRDPAQRRRAQQSPCETVVAGLVAESPRTAALASIPDRADQIAAVVRAVMATHPKCVGRIVNPSMEAILGDAEVTAAVHPDSVLTDASARIIDEMLLRIGAAASIADIQTALAMATAAAPTLGALDALAVQAAVAQSQGSLVLWGPGGAGWSELGVPLPAQSVFRGSEQTVDLLVGIVGALAADGAGCRAALSFLRALPFAYDPNFLMASCSAGAAVGTVYYGYTLVNQH